MNNYRYVTNYICANGSMHNILCTYVHIYVDQISIIDGSSESGVSHIFWNILFSFNYVVM